MIVKHCYFALFRLISFSRILAIGHFWLSLVNQGNELEDLLARLEGRA
jgi:hypothetical protein